MKCILIVLSALLAGMPVLGQDSKPLTNDDVVQMINSGLSVETVVKAIETQPTTFDGSAQALISLKKAGVSEAVITAMLQSMQRPNSLLKLSQGSEASGVNKFQTSEADDSSFPSEVGVYFREDDGRLVEIEPEIVTWRTGGFLKGIATMGLTRGHVNGVVRGPTSRSQLRGDEEIIIYTPEGTSASEYQLLRLDKKKDRREFRTLTGGVIHASGGADKNAVNFEPEKIAPRTYRIDLPQLEPGEYGFVAPGAAMSASAGSMGKFYGFSIGK